MVRRAGGWRVGGLLHVEGGGPCSMVVVVGRGACSMVRWGALLHGGGGGEGGLLHGEVGGPAPW